MSSTLLREWIELARHLTEADEEALRSEARSYASAIYSKGEAGYIDPDDANWREVPDYPLVRLAHLSTDWPAWLAQEMKDFAEDGREHRVADMQDMLDNGIHDAVLVYDDGQQGWLWDGWHRTGAAVTRGDKTIPAIVGTRRTA